MNLFPYKDAYKEVLLESVESDLKGAVEESDYQKLHKILHANNDISNEIVCKMLEKANNEGDRRVIDILTNYLHDPKREVDLMVLRDAQKLVQVSNAKDNNMNQRPGNVVAE